MHLHSYLLVNAKPQHRMSHKERNMQSDEEISNPYTPTFPVAENHGRLEAWFKGHEDKIQVFLIEITHKQIIIPKVFVSPS